MHWDPNLTGPITDTVSTSQNDALHYRVHYFCVACYWKAGTVQPIISSKEDQDSFLNVFDKAFVSDMKWHEKNLSTECTKQIC